MITEIILLLLATSLVYGSSSPFWGIPGPVLVYQRPIDAMVDVTNDLGVAVLQDYAYTRSNFAFSPYGVASVLVVLYEGARGESARQIHNTLRLPWNTDITRIGFRDIHRHLRSYFSHEGYLSGLTLNKNHTSLLLEYRRVLRFYGYDVGLAPGDSFPPTTTTKKPTTTTTPEPTQDISSTLDTTETTMTTIEPRIMPTETEATTTETTTETITRTTALPTAETTAEPETTTEEDLIPPTTTPITTTPSEDGFTLITLNIPRESTTSSRPEYDETITTESASDATPGGEQTSSQLFEPTTSAVSPMEDEVVTTPEEITFTAVLGQAPEESTSIVSHETTETVATTEQPTETMAPTEQPTEPMSPTVQPMETVAPTEQPTETMAPTETTFPTERPTETMAPTAQPAEPMAPTVQPIQTVAPTEQPTETMTPTEKLTAPTEQTSSSESVTVEFSDASISTVESTIVGITATTVSDITDNTIPEDTSIEYATSTETDYGGSTVPEIEMLTESMSGISEARVRLGTPLPLAYNLSSPYSSENSTSEASNRTRRSIADAEVVFPDISLQLQNGMFDSQLSRGFELYTQLPKRPFLVDGVTEELVPVMSYTATFPFAYIRRLHAQALEFPLDDERYKLLLLLPVERRGLRQLIYDLTSCPLREIYQDLRPTRVQAIIPSFMVEGFVILTPTLQQLGIWDVFDPRRADLSGMSNDPELYVRNIEQSVTVVIRNYVKILDIQTRTMAARSTIERFVVTHPFLYFVLDTDTHVALIAGKIVDPLNSRIY